MKFKNKRDTRLFSTLAAPLVMIYADLYWYAKAKHNIELVITQTVSTSRIDRMLKRVSKSHLERRAIDIRTRDIDAFIVQDLCEYINTKKEYEQFHYLSNSGSNRLAYYHIGSEEHIHLAIHSKYAIK